MIAHYQRFKSNSRGNATTRKKWVKAIDAKVKQLLAPGAGNNADGAVTILEELPELPSKPPKLVRSARALPAAASKSKSALKSSDDSKSSKKAKPAAEPVAKAASPIVSSAAAEQAVAATVDRHVAMAAEQAIAVVPDDVVVAIAPPPQPPQQPALRRSNASIFDEDMSRIPLGRNMDYMNLEAAVEDLLDGEPVTSDDDVRPSATAASSTAEQPDADVLPSATAASSTAAQPEAEPKTDPLAHLKIDLQEEALADNRGTIVARAAIVRSGFEPRKGAFVQLADGATKFTSRMEARGEEVVGIFNVYGEEVEFEIHGLTATNIEAAKAAVVPKYNSAPVKQHPILFTGVHMWPP